MNWPERSKSVGPNANRIFDTNVNRTNHRRAETVRDFLLSCGLEAAWLHAVGMGGPTNAAPSDATTPKQVESRVAFKVSSSHVLLPRSKPGESAHRWRARSDAIHNLNLRA